MDTILIKGIEVLNEHSVYLTNDVAINFVLIWVCGVIGLILIINMFVEISEWKNPFKKFYTYGGFMCLIACVLNIVALINNETKQYQVIISDEVSFVELEEKYEIINHDGKIYTILEKETVKEKEDRESKERKESEE